MFALLAATSGLEAQSAGQKIFQGKGLCYACHGKDARGTPLAPNLTDSEWLNIDGSLPAIVAEEMDADWSRVTTRQLPLMLKRGDQGQMAWKFVPQGAGGSTSVGHALIVGRLLDSKSASERRIGQSHQKRRRDGRADVGQLVRDSLELAHRSIRDQ